MTKTASSTLKILPASKVEVLNFARKLENELNNGQINALDLVVYKKCIDKVFDTIKQTLDPIARAEAEKHGQKVFTFKGIKVELAENGTTYDYTNCKDPELPDLITAVKLATQNLKDRQEFLKSLKTKLEVVDTRTGEVITLFPPVKSSISGIKSELI